MNNKQVNKSKEAGKANLHQPLQDLDKAAQPEQLVEGKSSSGAVDKQAKVNAAAVNHLLENAFYSESIGFFENGVLLTLNQTMEEFEEKTYRGKIYQIGKSKRFYYLFNDEWFKVTPDDVKDGEARLGWTKGAAKNLIPSWEEVCQQFRQVVWKKSLNCGGRR